MSRHHYDHILANDRFHELVAEKSRLEWTLAAMMMLVYYGFILVIAYFPEWLGTPLSADTSISWGLPVGIGIIVFTFVITGVYVHRANTLYDRLMQNVIDASNLHVDGMQTAAQDSEAGRP